MKAAAVSQGAGGEIELLERSEFIEALDESLASVVSGDGRLVLVSGEAGIGKSALVRGFCAAHRAHARVLRGACDALGAPRPLGPVTDIAASAQGAVLTCVRRGDKPYAVFVALLEELQAPSPTIVVIEDAHWADEATLDIIRLLARRAESLGALVLITYRDDELDAAHPLRLAVGELGTAPGVIQLRLPSLSRGAVEELAGSYGVDAEELYVKTGGNPFFVTEVLAVGGTEVPPTVRDAVFARMRRLGASAQGVLEAVAIVPPSIEMWLLDEILPDEAEHVDACLAAGILRADGRTVSFRHELARLAVEQAIGPHSRVVLHRRVLHALGHPPDGAADPARLAHHADGAGTADAALQHATVAGERAAAQGAHREAAAQYARALRYAGSLPPAELAVLCELRAQECYLTDQIDEAVAAQERALECHRELADRRSEAMALCRLSEMLFCPGRITESERAGRDAVDVLAGLKPGRELAAAYANLAELALWEDHDAAVEWARRSQGLAERLGEAEIGLGVRILLDALQYSRGVRGSRERLEEARTIAEGAGLDTLVAHCWAGLVWGAIEQRSYADLDAYAEAAVAYCREHDQEMRLRYVHMNRARAALDRARWTEATEAALAVLHDQGPSILPRIVSLTVLALVRKRRGEPGESELLDRASALAELQGRRYALAPVVAAQAEVAWLEGRREAIGDLTEAPLELALRLGVAREAGELARWRWRAGIRESVSCAEGPDAATLAGDWQLAARLWTELGCPYEAALALGDADDDDAIARGLTELHHLGARPAAAILTRRLRERGVRRVPRGPYAAARSNPASLTPRELEVLALVADGLRNADIAARLVVSSRTVDHHVSAVLRKLGAGTRGEAAAIAVRDKLTAKDG